MSSLLPDHMEANTISRMSVGDIAYTTPWGMYAETDRTMWINGSYPAQASPGGTVYMRIKRTSAGIVVDMSTIGDQEYSATGPFFMGAFEPIPVTLVEEIDVAELGGADRLLRFLDE